ncbi:hypothetical protein [Sphingopyxis sp. MWB1]|uniref:hypothetical protein n=1 Tax=Sphingopyxis sp. MWB1 TaxID=1537715 RepID=UPI00051A7465|nr:hypothetical protein [Sphingopyxis sp. MWB1]
MVRAPDIGPALIGGAVILAVQMASIWCAHDLDGVSAAFLIGSTLAGWFLALEIGSLAFSPGLMRYDLPTVVSNLLARQPLTRPRPIMARSAANRIPYYRFRQQTEIGGEKSPRSTARCRGPGQV